MSKRRSGALAFLAMFSTGGSALAESTKNVDVCPPATGVQEIKKSDNELSGYSVSSVVNFHTNQVCTAMAWGATTISCQPMTELTDLQRQTLHQEFCRDFNPK